MISIMNLNKKFEDKILFNNFNLNIQRGKFIIFSGVSGCGKTTLLNIIGALETVDSGKVLVNEIDITDKKNTLNYFKDTVAFLFQNFILIENKTIAENLKLIPKKSRSNMCIDEALTLVGLKDKINKKVYTLSGGEQQRVALARLMLKKCDLILADEPTGSLDKENADRVIKILKDLNKRGITVILVTHDDIIKKQGDILIEL